MNQSAGQARFEVLDRLGAGGFGEVYLATMYTDGGLERKVALKTLKGTDPQDPGWRRMRDEGKLLAMLHHPAILQVVDLVTFEGRPALVTEYIAGEDLEQVVRCPDPPSVRAAVEVVETVAAALAAAYDTPGPDGQPLRLVHRDIKPANIRLSPSGTIKVLDFGIAVAEMARESVTETGGVLGTVSYLPPERLDDPRRHHAEGDVYALGCVLFEAVTGRRLFTGGPTDLLRMAADPGKHRTLVLQQLGTLKAPAPVRSLLSRMLATDPADRPSAAEVEVACGAMLGTLEGLSLRAWARKHPWPAPSTRKALPTDSTLVAPASQSRPQPGHALKGLLPKVLGVSLAAAATAGMLLLGALWYFLRDTKPADPVMSVATEEPPADVPAVAAPPATAPPTEEAVAAATPVEEAPTVAPVPAGATTTTGKTAGATAATGKTAGAPAAGSSTGSRSASTPVAGNVDAASDVARPEAGATGKVVVTGSATVTLRKGGRSYPVGEVAVGTYAVVADFGGGPMDFLPVTVRAGQTATIKCSKYTSSCEVQE